MPLREVLKAFGSKLDTQWKYEASWKAVVLPVIVAFNAFQVGDSLRVECKTQISCHIVIAQFLTPLIILLKIL